DGIGPLVELGAIEEAVEVAIDADPGARARRDAGVDLLLPRRRGEVAERRLREHRVRVAVGLEVVAADVDRAARLAVDVALDDQVAVPGVVARDQEVDATGARGVVREAEHADLLVEVPEVRDLELLLLSLEGREAVRAEEPARDVEGVAGVALLRVDRRVEVEGLTRRLRAGERVVERADRIRRIADGQNEVGVRLHVGRRELARGAEETDEGRVELLEGAILVEWLPARVVAGGPVAAPVHRTGVRHAAQALRRHRPLHRMEGVGLGYLQAERVRVVRHRAERVTQVPRHRVEVAEDMTAGARAVAVS